MTSSSNNLVLFTLAMAERPLSISDVQFRCGLSYNTVKRAVLGNPQVKKHDGYPAMFSLSKPGVFDGKTLWAQYDKPEEGWLTWLDQIRPLLVSITAISDVVSVEERERKASMFHSLGRSFLSLAKDLENTDDTFG